MKQNNTILKIDNVSKTVKKKQLLEPFSYELNKGKILALCGGNGAGKSTLIRMIVGLFQATTGTITLNGLQQKEHRQLYKEQFGYMPDNFTFQKEMTAKETIQFYARIKNIDQATYENVIKEVGLFEKLQEQVGNFSKGMNQRLLLAQALLARPNFLILDEPTNGLDPYWIDRLATILLEAKEKGQTIIFSTHDLHIAEEVADEVLFLSNGKVISSGPIEQYRQDGLHATFQQLYFKNLKKTT